jgi:hypothetical protein
MLFIRLKSGKNYRLSVGENLSFEKQAEIVLMAAINKTHGYYINDFIAIKVSEIDVIEKAD